MADTRPTRQPCRCAYCLQLNAGAPPTRTPEDAQRTTTPEQGAKPFSTRKPQS